MKRLLALSLLLIVGLLVTACGAVTTDTNISMRGITVTLTLTEAELNAEIAARAAARQAADPNAELLVQGASVDFAPDSITLSGQFRAPNSGSVDGSITFGLSTTDGRLNVNVRSVSITGYDENDQLVTDMTLMVEQILNNRAGRLAQGDAEATAEVTEEAAEETAVASEPTDIPIFTIDSASITDDAIQIVIRLNSR
jgi:hypothetical protein